MPSDPVSATEKRVAELQRLLRKVTALHMELFARVDYDPNEELAHDLKTTDRSLRYAEEDLAAALEKSRGETVV